MLIGVTMAKKNEKLSQQWYQSIMAEVQDCAIILLDREGMVENWSVGAERMKGYQAEEVTGRNFRMFYSHENQESRLPEWQLAEAHEYGKSIHEGLRMRKDGSSFWGSTVITALYNEQHEVIGFLKVTRDLTERKLLEDTLRTNTQRLAEKNRELEKMNQELASFAYVSSHDLQEPLRKIQTFASRIATTESDRLSDKGKDFFGRIQQAASRMQKLLQDLLSYSRAITEEVHFQKTDLNTLLEKVKNQWKDTIEEKEAILHVHHLPVLHIIPFQFQRLLTNLVGNALKFHKPGLSPRIDIRARITHGKELNMQQANNTWEYCHISVTDNGIGFDPQFVDRIFEVFQRLHTRDEYEGTGIGLAICKKIAENHHGFMTAEGRPGQGANFNVYIPVL